MKTNLQFISIFRTGAHILPYLQPLERVLEKILLMASKEGQRFALDIIKNILLSLTSTYPEEFRFIIQFNSK